MERRLFFSLKLVALSGLLARINIEADGRTSVRLGDEKKGFVASASFDSGDLDCAADWFENQVVRHYPKSEFVKVRMLICAAEAGVYL